MTILSKRAIFGQADSCGSVTVLCEPQRHGCPFRRTVASNGVACDRNWSCACAARRRWAPARHYNRRHRRRWAARERARQRVVTKTFGPRGTATGTIAPGAKARWARPDTVRATRKAAAKRRSGAAYAPTISPRRLLRRLPRVVRPLHRSGSTSGRCVV